MSIASTRRVSRSTRVTLVLLGALSPLFAPVQTDAAPRYWKVGNGNWNVAANWSNSADFSTAGAVPVAADTANIWNNDATNRMITLNANATITNLNIANVFTGTSTFAQGTRNLTSVNESIAGRGNGNNARGAYTQSGGTNTLGGFLAVGDVTGSIGSYTMTGGTLNFTGADSGRGFYIGNNGAGTFTQSGSSVITVGSTSVPVNTYFGYGAGSLGTYNHNGGSFNTAGNMLVGISGEGILNLNAGTTTIGGSLNVANNFNGSKGTITVGANATLNVNGETVLGGSVPGNAFGPGRLNIEGNVTLKNLFIAQSGAVTLNGGTLTVDSFIRRPPSSGFNWISGTLNIPSMSISNISTTNNYGPFPGNMTLDNNVTLNVRDYFGISDVPGYSGIFTQNNGTITVGTPTNTGSFYSKGTYTLANTGTLNVKGNVNIAGGNFSVNGGTMSVTGGLDHAASLNLGGGSLSIGGPVTSGAGINQSGGALTLAAGLLLPGVAFNQSGGTATVGASVNTYGGGMINLSNGAQLTVSGPVNLGNTTSAGRLAVDGAAMTINNSLVSHHSGAEIKVTAGILAANTLNFAGPVNQTGGTLTVGTGRNQGGSLTLAGGSATFNNELTVNLNGFVNVGNTGSLEVNGSIYLGGDSASIGGVGLFGINGGTATITGAFKAYGGGVDVSGGTLTAGSMQVGSTAKYTQNAGTLVTNSLGAANAQEFKFNGGTITVNGGAFNIPSDGLTVGDGTRAATLNLAAGTVSNARLTVATGSSLAGNGAINNGLTLHGQLSPGSSSGAGTLTLSGASTFGPTSKTVIKLINATTADHIDAGALSLGGTLELSSGFGFAAPYYSSQRLINSTSLSGQFNQLAGNLRPLGAALAITYDAQGVLLTTAIDGDVNLDRAVNFDDLLIVAQHYGQTTGQTWSTGDLNGTGGVDFDDLLGLAQSYGQQISGLSVADSSVLSPEFATEWALARSLVPEPATLFTLPVAVSLMGRRRDRR